MVGLKDARRHFGEGAIAAEVHHHIHGLGVAVEPVAQCSDGTAIGLRIEQFHLTAVAFKFSDSFGYPTFGPTRLCRWVGDKQVATRLRGTHAF